MFGLKCQVSKQIDSDDKLVECHVDQNVLLQKLSLFKYTRKGTRQVWQAPESGSLTDFL